MNFRQNLTTIFIGLMLSTSGFALDLEREHLLDLYHGVETERTDDSTAQQEWVNLSVGIAPSYEDEFADIEFSPLYDEPKTQFGVFSGDISEPTKSDLGYQLNNTPTQFGHSEDERYGVFLKQRF